VGAHLGPALFVLAAWWLSTAALLRLVWLPRGARPATLAALSVVAVAGFVGVAWTRELATEAGAYGAFVCGLSIWAWHELTFLLGLVAGPRRAPCPPEAHGWERFRLATATVIHHEIALASTLLALAALTWGAANQVATWTFLVLWSMRLSAKLNIFLGVSNISAELIPPVLRHLPSYFRRARLNPLMPLSLLGSGAVLALLAHRAVAAPEGFAAVAYTLTAVLLALALLEHVFLAVPLPDVLLWRWAIRRTDSTRSPAAPERDVSPEAARESA
jgi:putative photosynthetic complex assembly protein 2